MPLKLQNLSVLKLKMTQEKEIADAYNYFFDHFGENRSFLNRSKPARHPLLEAVLGRVVGGLLGATETRAAAAKLIMLTIPEHSFYHGAWMIGGHLVNFIYFEDIHLGCMAIAPSHGQLLTRFVRFSTTTLPTTLGESAPN